MSHITLKALEQEITARFGELGPEQLQAQMLGLALLLEVEPTDDTTLTELQHNFACRALDLLQSGQAQTYEQAKQLLNQPQQPQTQETELHIQPNPQAVNTDVTETISSHARGLVHRIPDILDTQAEDFEAGINAAVAAEVNRLLQGYDLKGEVEARMKRRTAGKEQTPNSFMEALGIPIQGAPNPKQLPGS